MDTISVTKIFTKYEPIPKWVKAAKLLELTCLTVVIPLYSTAPRPPCTGQNLFSKNLFFPQISKKGARANENQNIKLFCPYRLLKKYGPEITWTRTIMDLLGFFFFMDLFFWSDTCVGFFCTCPEF